MWTQTSFNEGQENTERILNALKLDFKTRKQSTTISTPSDNELNFYFNYYWVIIILERSVPYTPPSSCLSQDWTKFSWLGQSYHDVVNPGWLTVSNVIIKSIKNAQICRYYFEYTSRSFQAVKMMLVFLHFIQCDITIPEFSFPQKHHSVQDIWEKTKPGTVMFSFPLKFLMWLIAYKVQRHSIYQHESDREVNAVM